MESLRNKNITDHPPASHNDEEEYSIGEHNPFNSSLRTDNELFKDEDNIVHTIVNVKRLQRGRQENWDILENNRKVLRIKGVRFTNKEREFLRTSSGAKFIIDGYKSGWRSINKFKQHIKDNYDYIQRDKVGH